MNFSIPITSGHDREKVKINKNYTPCFDVDGTQSKISFNPGLLTLFAIQVKLTKMGGHNYRRSQLQ